MAAQPVNPVKRSRQRFGIEFGFWMAAYVGVIWGSRWLLRGPMRQASEGWQIAVALLPIVPVAFVFAATVRFVRGMDEFYRRIYVDSFAIAGGVTALLAVTYGLIENKHFPSLSAWWTYVTFMVAWGIAVFFVERRYR
jgi:hypothetical protein